MVSPIGFQSFPRPSRPIELRPDMVLSVSLRVSGEELDPASVTDALNLQATDSARKGELLRERGAHQLKSSIGVWFSQIQSRGLSFDEQLPDQAPIAPAIIRRLESVRGFELVELSFLLNGPKQVIIEFVNLNAKSLTERISSEANYVDVDLDIPTAGLDIIVEKGHSLEPEFLRQQLGLRSAPMLR